MYGGRSYNHSHHHHHHYPNHNHKGTVPPANAAMSPDSALAADIFEQFISASTFKLVLHHYRHMCDILRLRPQIIRQFYPKLKNKIRSWKAQALWSKFDKRAAHKCYNHGKACNNTKILIIGAGPCGLRSAIEAQLLGAKVVVVEKRDRFSRNNVLHLWPFVITDLKALGAKKFYGKFCAGAIDHISIRQLQCMLLKVALLLGVEIFEGVTFEELLEPPDDQCQNIGWHARFSPMEHPVNQYEFDVLIGADGKRNTLMGFKRKEFRGKLAIAITANFINKHSEQEARVQEISGVAFIFNQKFFKDLYAETGIDLENIVYYKDETHYFVMTAKKHSLIDKGVILRDLPDTQQLLHPNNVDRKALCDYAREAADFSTAYQMPHLHFAVNHYGKPDIAMFDFTSMFAAENACRMVEKKGHKLLQCLVGDSLLEPFWPTGSGCARGFLSSFDACWAVRSWALNKMTPLEVIAERESIYRLLAQTTPENLSKDYSAYTLEPSSRYPTVNFKVLLAFQVRHLFISDSLDNGEAMTPVDPLENPLSVDDVPRKRKRRDSVIQPDTLLSWCQKQVAHVEDLKIEDLGCSFKDGRALCTILHRYRPDLIDLECMDLSDHAHNCQLAFDIIEKEFAVCSGITGEELANSEAGQVPDLISYISQIHDALRGEIPHSMGARLPIKSLKAQTVEGLDLADFPDQLLEENKDSKVLLENNNPSSTSYSSSINNTRLSCRLVEEPKPECLSKEDLQKTKRRRNEFGSLDKMNEECETLSGAKPYSEGFSDRVKGLEAKFKGDQGPNSQQKPKDLIRAVGKLEKTDWNLSAIERKIKDNPRPVLGLSDKERVPKWSRDTYNDKFQNIERRLRENGEDEERIAKYLDIDASLKRLERKLREGSTLETGLRGHNKVSNLASQLSSKLVRTDDKTYKATTVAPKQTRAIILPSSGSDLCYFCDSRVYLVERLSAEGKFFHRQCFKCSYCGALLRLGSYIYDRENRYGGNFFCIPHFGLTARSRGSKKIEHASRDTESNQELAHTVNFFSSDVTDVVASSIREPEGNKIVNPPCSVNSSKRIDTKDSSTHLLTPARKEESLLDRDATPERVEFENSVIEHSDEEEYLSEDEWTDRNFGASANELDDDDDEDSDYSDLSDEEGDEVALLETPQKMTVDETRRLAESWKRRYSSDVLEMSDDQESFSESENDEMSEHGAEGDESHTPTEGEAGDNDDDDDDFEDDDVKRARELRRLELNINVEAPPRKAETSDSGSETEVGSEEESDTQIDTDSEFADDREASKLPKEIPTIVIDEMPKETKEEEKEIKESKTPSYPEAKYISQVIQTRSSVEKEGAERSASLSNLHTTLPIGPNPRTEQLKRLLHRTESTEAVSAQRNVLRRQYLLGNTSSMPKKSVSTADLGNRFKSFMDKISETQKKLQPAPQPSPAMQAFLNLSNKSNSSTPPSFSHISPHNCSSLKNSLNSTPSEMFSFENDPASSPLGLVKSDDSSDSSSKSEEGKLLTFSSVNRNTDDHQVPHNRNSSSSITAYDNIEGVTLENCLLTSPEDKSQGEKGVLDSEQSEKEDFIMDLEVQNFNEEECIFAKNSDLIEAFNENEVEAVNLELISNENSKNVTIDTLCKYESEEPFLDESVDAAFDQLANDAITELNQSTPPCSNMLTNEEENLEKLSPILDRNFNLKLENLLTSCEKMQDEPGFKSLGDVKSLTSDINMDSSRLEENEGLESIGHNLNQNEIVSPETEVASTEADLSDWGDDNEAFAFNPADFETEVQENSKFSIPKQSSSTGLNLDKAIARIASLESLGDSDSAISIGVCKTTSQPKPSPLAELENMEYMDSSDSESSHEEAPSVSIMYNKLQDYASPSPSNEMELSDVHLLGSCRESKSLIPALKDMKSKSLDADDTLNETLPARSLSDPRPLSKSLHNVPSVESILESSSESPSNSSSQSNTRIACSRYEGYIPRFKDRVTPFGLARDSIDVRKNTSFKPLFTPSREDVLQRERNECDRLKDFSEGSNENKSRAREKIKKDGDLVRDMVMSRIVKKNSDKGRRGSRNALHLSMHSSSSSSLFGSEPSLNRSKASFSADKSISISEADTPDKTQVVKMYNSSVPSEERQYLEECKSDISFSKLSSSLNKITIISPIEKKPQYSPRNILPATPLTHPEKFQRGEILKRELFKSSPQLHQPSLPYHSYPSPTYSPPNEPFSQSCYSDFSILQNRNGNLSKSPTNNGCDIPLEGKINIETEIETGLNTDLDGTIETLQRKEEAEKPKKDPNTRLKELLEERRRKDGEDQKEVRLRNKDSCLQECLEEYRQKRSSAPVFTQNPALLSPSKDAKGNLGNTQTRIQLGLAKRQLHRPSILELESMQIFSAPSRITNQDDTPSGECLAIVPSISTESSPLSNTSSSRDPPTTPQNEMPEKKSSKKSKDRYRRRSLIQIVAGMFSKTDEKKKDKDECETDTKKESFEKSLSPISPSISVPPKSPSVKERFSKLRLSRSKEKKKSPDKNRSSSMDVNPSITLDAKETTNALSLPTSPSRTIFSFLSSSPAPKSNEKGSGSSRNSTPGSSASYFSQRFSPSCIKEENNSEDESTQGGVAPISKDSTISTPSVRRQKAALRAAKQAEQKRLRMAQEIQRQLEECDVKTRELEEKGIGVEKALIGETDGSARNESELKKEWFGLIQEKNALVRWQEELTVKARELELEDRHLRLENELRQRMTSAEREKTREDIEREGQILAEIISIIEQKDALVNLLEEDRQRYIEEDRDLELVHARKVLQRPLFERETGV